MNLTQTPSLRMLVSAVLSFAMTSASFASTPVGTGWVIDAQMSPTTQPKPLSAPTPSTEDVAKLRAMGCVQDIGAMTRLGVQYRAKSGDLVRVTVRTIDLSGLAARGWQLVGANSTPPGAVWLSRPLLNELGVPPDAPAPPGVSEVAFTQSVAGQPAAAARTTQVAVVGTVQATPGASAEIKGSVAIRLGETTLSALGRLTPEQLRQTAIPPTVYVRLKAPSGDAKGSPDTNAACVAEVREEVNKWSGRSGLKFTVEPIAVR